MKDETAMRTDDCLIEPFGARIAVKVDGFKYSGKIIIPDQAKVVPTTGIVKAIGPRVNSDLANENKVSLGDHLVFSTFAGVGVKLQKEFYKIIGADEILGRIPPETSLEEQVP